MATAARVRNPLRDDSASAAPGRNGRPRAHRPPGPRPAGQASQNPSPQGFLTCPEKGTEARTNRPINDCVFSGVIVCRSGDFCADRRAVLGRARTIGSTFGWTAGVLRTAPFEVCGPEQPLSFERVASQHRSRGGWQGRWQLAPEPRSNQHRNQVTGIPPAIPRNHPRRHRHRCHSRRRP